MIKVLAKHGIEFTPNRSVPLALVKLTTEQDGNPEHITLGAGVVDGWSIWDPDHGAPCCFVDGHVFADAAGNPCWNPGASKRLANQVVAIVLDHVESVI